MKFSLMRFFAYLVLASFLMLLFTHLLNAQPAETGMNNLEAPVNTEVDEFSPSVTADGNTMVFNRTVGGTTYQDIFITNKVDGKWQTPQPMTALNSPYNDETPYITPDGNYIIFASDRDGSIEASRDANGRVRVSFDLYLAQRTTSGFSAPQKLQGEINSALHERAPSLSLDGSKLFFTRFSFGNMNESAIYSADLIQGKFVNITRLPDVINSGNREVGFVPVFPGNSGQQAKKGYYFSSARPGGLGGWDLYYIEEKDEGFAEPVNLGPAVNTAANEVYLSVAGETMFLASNRKGGKGLYDLYSTTLPHENSIKFRVSNAITFEPVSVEAAISAEVKTPQGVQKAAISKTTDSEGIFTLTANPSVQAITVRIDEPGYKTFEAFYELDTLNTDEIVEIKLLPEARGYHFLTRDAVTGNAVTAELEIHNDPKVVTTSTDSKGEVTVEFKTNKKDLPVSVSAPGYLPVIRKPAELSQDKENPSIIELVRATKDASFDIHAIYFDPNSSIIRSDSYPMLTQLTGFLKKNHDIRLKVIGHTDLHGTLEYNDKLSLKRARSVKKYLVNNGISEDRLEVSGAGFRRPVVNKKGKGFDEKNRRTEFKILSN